jgi:peptidyl-prolyl cis-trans isomerase D
LDSIGPNGRLADGALVSDLPAGVNVVEAAFTTDVGVDTEPLQIPGGGYVWYEVLGVTPARERGVDEIKGTVEELWRDDQVAGRLKAKADALVDKLKAGISLADAAKPDGLKVETATGIKRNGQRGALSPAAVEAIFRTLKGAAGNAEGADQTHRIVFRVTDVTEPKLDPAAPETKRVNDLRRNAMMEELLDQYVQRLQAELGTSINQDALLRVVGGGQQN